MKAVMDRLPWTVRDKVYRYLQNRITVVVESAEYGDIADIYVHDGSHDPQYIYQLDNGKWAVASGATLDGGDSHPTKVLYTRQSEDSKNYYETYG